MAIKTTCPSVKLKKNVEVIFKAYYQEVGYKSEIAIKKYTPQGVYFFII